MEQVISVKAIKKLISESSNEFKAVLGPNVESEDKKNNGKAYSDAKKRAKDYDGGLEHEMLEERPDYEKVDGNGTTLDYNPENVSKETKDRWKAQAEGYTSVAEKNNGLEKTGDRKGNKNAYDGIKKAGQEMHKNQKEVKRSGLTARERDPKIFDKEEMYESKDGFDMRNMIDKLRSNVPPTVLKEHVKTVYFKKTQFLNEEHMITRIPDEFKNEGEQFKMKDKTGNTYLMEWRNGEAKVLGHSNKQQVDESLNRIKAMYNYASEDTKTTNRANENNDSFTNTLNAARKIIK